MTAKRSTRKQRSEELRVFLRIVSLTRRCIKVARLKRDWGPTEFLASQFDEAARAAWRWVPANERAEAVAALRSLIAYASSERRPKKARP